MRLLIIAERFFPQRGGLAVSANRIARNLAARDAEVHVFTMTKEIAGGDLESARFENILAHRLGAFSSFDRTYMVACRAIELLHHRHPYDAIIGIYMVYSGYLAAMQGRMLGVPSLALARGNDVDRELWRPERFQFLKAAVDWASAIGCVSTELVKKCNLIAGSDKAHFIANSVDTNVFTPGEGDAELRLSLGLGKGPVVGFSGEMRFKKGMHHFIEAARQLSATNPSARFLIAGGVREEDRAEYESALNEEPSPRNVIVEAPYLKKPEEIVNYYRLMDILFLPSLWEGMPNAALEAMACGKPVAASSAGGLADLVDAPRTGRLFAPGDFEAGIDALKSILSMPGDVLRAMGIRARERVIEEFSPEKETSRVLELIDSIISQKTAG